MTLQDEMFEAQNEKKIYDLARSYAYHYADHISKMDVFPGEENLKNLGVFDQPLSQDRTPAMDVLEMLHHYGGPGTTAQTGGRYFGYVNGGALPVAVAVKWLTDFWDQCSGLYLTSPINATLESVCESWLKDIFKFPEDTVAGFVSGTSMANLSALSAARYRLLQNAGWDINEKGLNGAPEIRIIAHRQVHASIKKTLTILGFGHQNIEWIDADDQGRAIAARMPELDATCLVLLQAGNVNTGAFDPFNKICPQASAAGSWVHVDGAFGLWARACPSMEYLTEGLEMAHSWAVDGHKTLNTPYDNGIVMCRDREALVNSLQATAEYISYSDKREPLHFGPEMSKRSRAIELWATLKYLGKNGIDELVTGLHLKARQLERGLRKAGFIVLNDVVFNQVLVKCTTDEKTKETLLNIQKSGECWCGSTTWKNDAAIRISICSWATTEEDIEKTIETFQRSIPT